MLGESRGDVPVFVKRKLERQLGFLFCFVLLCHSIRLVYPGLYFIKLYEEGKQDDLAMNIRLTCNRIEA